MAWLVGGVRVVEVGGGAVVAAADINESDLSCGVSPEGGGGSEEGSVRDKSEAMEKVEGLDRFAGGVVGLLGEAGAGVDVGGSCEDEESWLIMLLPSGK